MKKTSVLSGLAFSSLVAMGIAHAADNNPYAAQPMKQGYQNTAKAKEGKCGEGKCGSHKPSSTKKAEGKCGEGKCGGHK